MMLVSTDTVAWIGRNGLNYNSVLESGTHTRIQTKMHLGLIMIKYDLV